MDKPSPNTDAVEIDKFSKLADIWWEPKGPMRGLHDINPVRVNYIKDKADVDGKTILDVGCGGGILSESLARQGAKVTGIDMNAAALNIAKIHAKHSHLSIQYQHTTAETLADTRRGKFDIITCMEVLEHVPRPLSVVNACKMLVKPGGHVFFATLNRTWTAYVLAIMAAEYIFGIVGRGTHNFKRFIKPDELSGWAKQAGLVQKALSGIRYIPWGPICYLTQDTRVNYIMHCKALSDLRKKCVFKSEARNAKSETKGDPYALMEKPRLV